jgi:hypothetical protein
MAGQLDLFPAPERQGVKPATMAQADRDGKASWRSYSGPHRACDECVVFLHENGGQGPHPRPARRTRTVKATGERLDLCTGHAEPRELADGHAKDAAKLAEQRSAAARKAAATRKANRSARRPA